MNLGLYKSIGSRIGKKGLDLFLKRAFKKEDQLHVAPDETLMLRIQR